MQTEAKRKDFLSKATSFLGVTNNLNIELALFFNPNADNKDEVTKALCLWLDKYGEIFRNVIDLDNILYPKSPIVCLCSWDEAGQLKDPQKIVPFLVSILLLVEVLGQGEDVWRMVEKLLVLKHLRLLYLPQTT